MTYTLGECCSPSVRPAFRRRCRIPREKLSAGKESEGSAFNSDSASVKSKKTYFLNLFYMYLTSCILIPLISPSLPTCPPPNKFKRKKETFQKGKEFKISSWKLQCDTLFISDVDLGPLCTCAHMNTGNRDSVGRRGHRKDEQGCLRILLLHGEVSYFKCLLPLTTSSHHFFSPFLLPISVAGA